MFDNKDVMCVLGGGNGVYFFSTVVCVVRLFHETTFVDAWFVVCSGADAPPPGNRWMYCRVMA